MQSHDFRTTKITELATQVGLKATQQYVGHKREATTLRYVKCGAQEGFDAVAAAAAAEQGGRVAEQRGRLLGKRARMSEAPSILEKVARVQMLLEEVKGSKLGKLRPGKRQSKLASGRKQPTDRR